MNDATHAAINAYTRELANRLLLADVEIQVDREAPPQTDAWAMVWPSEQKHAALISVSPSLFHQSAEKVRKVIVHELLHIHTNKPWNYLSKIAEMFNDNTACQFACAKAHDEVEVLTENMARLLAPALPLPPAALFVAATPDRPEAYEG